MEVRSMSRQIAKTVTWVGKTDWVLSRFHGDEYSTHKGTTYNAYLVQDEKTALIDTVWKPFDKEFVQALRQVVALEQIDLIVCNHAEIDHSGALAEILREIPETPIYCTANGAKIIKGHHHQDWNFQIVKTGDTIELGRNRFVFIEAPMLHWPDTLFTYLTGENILFSNDGFGQHYASESLFNDTVDQAELYNEALKYYANILTPFSSQVTRKIKEVLGFNLPVDMICPSHGVIWKDHPAQIIEQYLKWADHYQENQVTIVFDSMWDSTRLMAEAISRGIRQADNQVTVKLYNAAKTDKNDILTEVFKSKAVLIGASTINNGYSYAVAGILEMMHGLKFKAKQAAAFGSYGWSGEAVKQVGDALVQAGFTLINEGLRVQWVPDETALAACQSYGSTVAAALV
jgi:flavorubredoxin